MTPKDSARRVREAIEEAIRWIDGWSNDCSDGTDANLRRTLDLALDEIRALERVAA